MTLTMTRTRTQMALTRLASLVANIHGELEFLEGLLAEHPECRAALEKRKAELLSDKDALYLTLNQFDPELEPAAIGTSDEWQKPYGRRGTKTALRRYRRVSR